MPPPFLSNDIIITKERVPISYPKKYFSFVRRALSGRSILENHKVFVPCHIRQKVKPMNYLPELHCNNVVARFLSDCLPCKAHISVGKGKTAAAGARCPTYKILWRKERIRMLFWAVLYSPFRSAVTRGDPFKQ